MKKYRETQKTSVYCRLLLVVCIAFSVQSCQSTGAKERAKERAVEKSRTARQQADLLANAEQTQMAILQMNERLEEFNKRAESLAEEMEKLKDSFGQFTKTYRSGALESAANTSHRLEQVESKITTLIINTKAYIGLMEKRNNISAGDHLSSVREQLKKTQVADPAEKQSRDEEKIDVADPVELYQNSYNAYLKGDYKLAIGGFLKYLKKYPATDLSDNAAFWVGESHFSAGDMSASVEAMDKVANSYPESNKAPSALLRGAEACIALNDNDKAVERLKKIVDKYIASKEAITATERLSQLGVTYPEIR